MIAATLPSRAMLGEVDRKLARAGIPYALGGSGLLAVHGLVDRVRDWDLTTDSTLDRLLPVLDELAPTYVGSSGIHSDCKLVFDGGTVELIVRFAIATEGRVVRVPTLVRGTWEGIPLGSLEAWAVGYSLLGREHRADPLFTHLEREGVDPTAVQRLLREPMPQALAVRLAALRVVRRPAEASQARASASTRGGSAPDR